LWKLADSKKGGRINTFFIFISILDNYTHTLNFRKKEKNTGPLLTLKNIGHTQHVVKMGPYTHIPELNARCAWHGWKGKRERSMEEMPVTRCIPSEGIERSMTLDDIPTIQAQSSPPPTPSLHMQLYHTINNSLFSELDCTW